MTRRVVAAIFKTLFVFGFAGWAYIAVIAVVHPQTLSQPLTHLVGWPREDTFGAVCFVVSAASFLGHELTRERV